MVEEMLAARGIVVSHEAVRQWALNFGQGFANEIGVGCREPATSAPPAQGANNPPKTRTSPPGDESARPSGTTGMP